MDGLGGVEGDDEESLEGGGVAGMITLRCVALRLELQVRSHSPPDLLHFAWAGLEMRDRRHTTLRCSCFFAFCSDPHSRQPALH